MNKIGLLGGTFNPIHTGHIALGLCAYKELNLDIVIFMSSGKSYLKSDIVMPSREVRFEMTKLAVSDYPFFEASDIEIKREGNTFTCDTLKELHEIYPDSDIYFIIGADTLFSMETWRAPEYIFANSIIVAAARGDYILNDYKEKIKYLNEKFNANIILLNFDKIDISSSNIREDLINDSTRAQALNQLPDKVSDYIIKNHLYSL